MRIIRVSPFIGIATALVLASAAIGHPAPAGGATHRMVPPPIHVMAPLPGPRPLARIMHLHRTNVTFPRHEQGQQHMLPRPENPGRPPVRSAKPGPRHVMLPRPVPIARPGG